jgi:monoterpene epsilon-lactone hydrolase
MPAMSSSPEVVQHVIDRVLGVYSGWRRSTPMTQIRAEWDRFLWSDAFPAQWQAVDAGGVPARWIIADGVDRDCTLLYFHGGGYKMGSAVSHHDLMARLSAAGACRVLGIDYRLLPEHMFPAPVEDAVAAYRWLLDQGVPTSRIAFAGDSAGAGLVAAAMFAARAQDLPLPAAGVMLSALTDFATTGASYETRAARDPIHQRVLIQALAQQYLGEGDRRDPLASPLYGDLRGLPPLLLQVGDRETGLDDSVMFAQRAREAGVPVTLEIWDGMIHVFQQFPNDLSEARDAIRRIGDFLNENWSTM